MSQRRGTLLGSVIFNLPQIFCFAKSLREPYVILMTVSLKYEVYALWVQIVSRRGGEPSSRDLILVHEFLSLRETNSVRGEVRHLNCLIAHECFCHSNDSKP